MAETSSNAKVEPLDYGRAPPRRRKILLWAAPAILVVLVGLSSWHWRAAIWTRAQILYYQWQCMRYTAPADQVVYEEEPAAAAKLFASGSRYKVFPVTRLYPVEGINSYQGAALTCSYWERYYALALPGHRRSWSDAGIADFLHERISSSGNHRLVAVALHPGLITTMVHLSLPERCQAISVEPATLLRAPGERSPFWGWGGKLTEPKVLPQTRVYAGQVDPKDDSHFTIRYQMWGQEDVLDGYLKDNDTVTLTARHPPKER